MMLDKIKDSEMRNSTCSRRPQSSTLEHRALRRCVLAFRGVISYILAKHGAEDDDEVEALLEELEEKQKDPDFSDKDAEFIGANYSDI